jgi:tellurite resistance protein
MIHERVQARRDRDLKSGLLSDKGVQLAQQRLEEQMNGYGLWGRRRLLTGALRVRRGMVPKLVEAFDHCRRVLGFDKPVELYVKPDPMFGAFMMKSPTGPLALAVTSRTIEGFSPAELRHVIGHELAHALFDHTGLPMPLTAMVEDMAGPIVSRPKALELYLWCRSAEISADRVGLVCCGDLNAAVASFMKLASGLDDEYLGTIDMEALASQHDSIASAPVARQKPREDDDTVEAFNTHPYVPLRIRALALFARSEAYFAARGVPAPLDALSLADVEKLIEGELEVMETSYLEEKSDGADLMRRALFCAALVVAHSDGDTLQETERKALVSLLGTEIFWPAPKIDAVRKELDEKLTQAKNDVSRVWRTQLVQHLAVIAAADGHIDPQELAAIDDICMKLDVPKKIVDDTLKTSARPLD